MTDIPKGYQLLTGEKILKREEKQQKDQLEYFFLSIVQARHDGGSDHGANRDGDDCGQTGRDEWEAG